MIRGAISMLAVACTLLLGTCSPPLSHLQQILKRGTLRVVTINGPTTYYLSGQGAAGFDYDTTRRFAHMLGVKLQITTARNRAQALRLLTRDKADIAAAGITTAMHHYGRIRFAPPLRTITSKLVYRMGEHKPSGLDDLDGKLMVEAGRSVNVHLLREAVKNPAFEWHQTKKYDAQELLHKVATGQLAYTVANSDLLAIDQRYYPKLDSAFTIGKPEKLAWALPAGPDHSLYKQTEKFVTALKKSKTLALLQDRYFGHLAQLDYVGSMTFARDAHQRLPRYEKDFKQAGKATHIDWRLLAAQAYQESHWKPRATSPTGVRGLMMLTIATAREMGISNRLNPSNSIRGGAKYLRQQLNRLPKSIKKPDLYWMALATYNIGLGHVMDARRITREQGGNPNHWIDVRKYLGLLTQPKWYTHTRYGYARGYEALTYVANIRSYYDILRWMTRANEKPKKSRRDKNKRNQQHGKPHNKALDVESPAL